MRIKLFLFLLVSLLMFSASKTKFYPKKCKGVYEGLIESSEYPVEGSEADKVVVSEAVVLIDLADENVSITVGDYKRTGLVEKSEKTKDYYSLEVHLEDESVETWRLFKKARRIDRITSRSRMNVTLFKK